MLKGEIHLEMAELERLDRHTKMEQTEWLKHKRTDTQTIRNSNIDKYNLLVIFLLQLTWVLKLE